MGIDILANLERKAHLIQPELGDREIRFALCSRSGFTPQLIRDAKGRGDILLWDLESLM